MANVFGIQIHQKDSELRIFLSLFTCATENMQLMHLNLKDEKFVQVIMIITRIVTYTAAPTGTIQ